MIGAILTYLALTLNAGIFIRLFTYERRGATYRPIISLIAAICMGIAGTNVLYIAKGFIVITTDQWPLLLILMMLFVSINRHKGNMSKVLQMYIPWVDVK